MGQPKLLLPWQDGLLIDSVLKAWTDSAVSQVVVVIRHDDHELAEACRRWPVTLIRPEIEPPDMKASVLCGLRHIQSACDPDATDRCFVAPADLPLLSAALIDQLMAETADSRSIVVPSFGDKQGHPAHFPWSMMRQIETLGPDEGINKIVKSSKTLDVPLPRSAAVTDIDTMSEYEQMVEKLR